MKASDLIKKLEELVKVNGDLDIEITDDSDYIYEVSNIVKSNYGAVDTIKIELYGF